MHWQRSFLIVTPSNCAFGSSLLNYIQFVNTLTKYKYKDGTKVPRCQVTVSFSHLIAYKLVLLRSCDIAYCVWFHREPLLLNFEKIALFKKISYSHSEQQSPMSAGKLQFLVCPLFCPPVPSIELPSFFALVMPLYMPSTDNLKCPLYILPFFNGMPSLGGPSTLAA